MKIDSNEEIVEKLLLSKRKKNLEGQSRDKLGKIKTFRLFIFKENYQNDRVKLIRNCTCEISNETIT